MNSAVGLAQKAKIPTAPTKTTVPKPGSLDAPVLKVERSRADAVEVMRQTCNGSFVEIPSAAHEGQEQQSIGIGIKQPIRKKIDPKPPAPHPFIFYQCRPVRP